MGMSMGGFRFESHNSWGENVTLPDKTLTLNALCPVIINAERFVQLQFVTKRDHRGDFDTDPR